MKKVIRKKEVVQAFGLIKRTETHEIVREYGQTEYVQVTFSTFFMGFLISSSVHLRKPSLKDAWGFA